MIILPTRKGNKEKKVYFSPSEWKMVCQKAEMLNLRVGTYIQRMAIFGKINVYDFSILMKLTFEINKIGTNINQIVHLCNETQNVNTKDVYRLKEAISKLEKKYDEFMKPLVDFRENSEESEDE